MFINIAKYFKTLRCSCGAVAFIFSNYLKPGLYVDDCGCMFQAAVHDTERSATAGVEGDGHPPLSRQVPAASYWTPVQERARQNRQVSSRSTTMLPLVYKALHCLIIIFYIIYNM